jgi:hypothetical protein
MTHEYYNIQYKAIQLRLEHMELPYNRLLVESRPVQGIPEIYFLSLF